MGSPGSGRRTYHGKRRTVEECWVMDISDVARVIDLMNLRPASGALRPIKPASWKRMSPVRCVLEVGRDGTPLLGLSYTVMERWGLGLRVTEVVPLQSTRPSFGGVRWWFSCPHMLDGDTCGHRVGKLYCPLEDRHFACRHCLDLTYESCQKSHRHDNLFALVAGETSGERFEAVKRAFSYHTKEARRQMAEPPATLLDAFEEVFDGAENH